MGAGLRIAQDCVLGDVVLNVHKASGWTSHDVVAKLRGLLMTRKIGHAGTLDPAATGVLPVLVGRATRIAEYLIDWDKEYRAILRLGETTDTQDATGTVLSTCAAQGLAQADIRAAVARFQGRLRQVPPMYSAVKVRGVPLYRAARSGRTVERRPRDITVHQIEVLEIMGRDVALRIVCSKGTYIRTLCADIGETLGVGGHLLTLERSRVGPLTLEQALTVEQLDLQCRLGRVTDGVLSLDEALARFPAAVLDQATEARVLHGVPVPLQAVHWEECSASVRPAAGQIVRFKNQAGRLLALGTVPAGLTDTDGSTPAPLPVVKVLVSQEESPQWLE